mmetsp:Transcript_35543/g.78270  ORF Transcript_35543/g.78270 Transcript_35543/m.78270 type:complete len:211 (-) Transcript_35543:605-1237(-)
MVRLGAAGHEHLLLVGVVGPAQRRPGNLLQICGQHAAVPPQDVQHRRPGSGVLLDLIGSGAPRLLHRDACLFGHRVEGRALALLLLVPHAQGGLGRGHIVPARKVHNDSVLAVLPCDDRQLASVAQHIHAGGQACAQLVVLSVHHDAQGLEGHFGGVHLLELATLGVTHELCECACAVRQGTQLLGQGHSIRDAAGHQGVFATVCFYSLS